MTAGNPTQDALLAALKAIVAECKTFAHDHDSYLPPHLLAAAQQAIAEYESQKGGRT
jgi:hypothetical protein